MGKNLVCTGYSHPVMEPPNLIESTKRARSRCGDSTRKIGGGGNIAGASPEPYKGLRYLGERVRRKAGKAGKGAK
jgi:large subunit ribosomal protein L6